MRQFIIANFPIILKNTLIAQFHCNHLGGKSLSEYGKKPIYSSVSNDVQNQIKINKQLKEIIKREIGVNGRKKL
jgi:hypothetical protein